MGCIICQQNGQTDLVDKPSKESFEKLLKMTRERVEHKDCQAMDFVKRTANHTAEKLISDNATYHKKCYANFANTGKVERARKCFSDSIEKGESSVIKRKAGGPSLSGITVSNKEALITRSKVITYDKILCIICQETGGKLQLVQTKETGKSMFSMSEKFSDKGFFSRA